MNIVITVIVVTYFYRNAVWYCHKDWQPSQSEHSRARLEAGGWDATECVRPGRD